MMFKKLLFLLLLCNLWYGYGTTENDTCAAAFPVPDPNFEMALFNLGIDTTPNDGQIDMAMAMMVTETNHRKRNAMVLSCLCRWLSLDWWLNENQHT